MKEELLPVLRFLYPVLELPVVVRTLEGMSGR
jgi:hypothetical protein